MTSNENARIALITSAKYGLTQFIFRDVKALIGRGHDVTLYMLLNEPGLYTPLPEWKTVVASKTRAATGLLRLLMTRPGIGFSLLRHAMRHKAVRSLGIAADFSRGMHDADLLFSYFGDHKLFVGYYCKAITGLPLTVTVRAYELYRNPNPDLFVEALAACDRVLTITEYNKAQLVERFGVPADKIDIVRQIVDLELHAPAEKVTVLAVGFFAEKKGYDVLLEAIRQLDRDDVELWIAGDHNPSILGTDVRAMVEHMGVDDRVALFGAQKGTALRALYREADVFCLASRTDSFGDKEGFPNVIAEAMAFGKPVVSTHHAGIPEAIDEIVVEEGDVDALAAALASVIDDEGLRRRLGERNRRRAEEMFSPENNADLSASLNRTAFSTHTEGRQ